jgi:hypothetical protein
VNALFEQSIAPSAGASARRSAALLLHGMSEPDRSWAWQQLSDYQREALAPLLRELHELGVPRDVELLHDMVGTAPATGPVPVTARERVAHAPAARMAALLAVEPAGLVRRLIALGPWPWQDEAMAVLRTRRGELFEPVSPDTNLAATALDEALLRRLADCVGPSAAVPVATKAPRWWHRLLGGATQATTRATR